MIAAHLPELAKGERTAWWRFWLTPLIAVCASIAIFKTISPRPVMLTAINVLVSTTELSGILLVTFASVIAVVHRKGFLAVTGPHWRTTYAGVVVWLLASVAQSSIQWALYPTAFTFTGIVAPIKLMLLGSLAIGLQTLAEEFIFRGYLLQAFAIAFRRPLYAALASSAIFAVLHSVNPGALYSVAGAFVFAFAASFIVIRFGSLWFTFGMHAANNLFGLLVVVNAHDVFSFAAGPIRYDGSKPQIDLALEAIGLIGVTLWVWRNDLEQLSLIWRGASYRAS